MKSTTVKNIPVNPTIPYDTLEAMIRRANTTEKLLIADEWLRANTVVSIPEYQALRKVWLQMGERFGTYRIILTSGAGVKHTYVSGLSKADAYRICRDSNWCLDMGYVWDMELEEEY